LVELDADLQAGTAAPAARGPVTRTATARGDCEERGGGHGKGRANASCDHLDFPSW
jgi:hypothetical protein